MYISFYCIYIMQYIYFCQNFRAQLMLDSSNSDFYKLDIYIRCIFLTVI